MNIGVVIPLRQRMIEDMTARKFSAGTQRLHISSCERLSVFLQRSPDTAPVEDIRRFPTVPRRVRDEHSQPQPADDCAGRSTSWRTR